MMTVPACVTLSVMTSRDVVVSRVWEASRHQYLSKAKADLASANTLIWHQS